MLDENDFRKQADSALESLKQSLIVAEESSDIEVEDQSGALHISFEDGARFVISPMRLCDKYGFRLWPPASNSIGQKRIGVSCCRRVAKT